MNILWNIVSPTKPRAGISKNVENHMRENVWWILFKTHNFNIFLGYTIAPSKCDFGNNLYNVRCGLGCGTFLIFRCTIG